MRPGPKGKAKLHDYTHKYGAQLKAPDLLSRSLFTIDRFMSIIGTGRRYDQQTDRLKLFRLKAVRVRLCLELSVGSHQLAV